MQRFTKRHRFSARKSRQLDAGRAAAAASSDSIADFISLVGEVFTKTSVNEAPTRIWNMDEKGWSKQQVLQQPVLSAVGKPQVIILQNYITKILSNRVFILLR